MNSHCFTVNRSYSFSFNLSNVLGLNPKGPYLSLKKEKENFCVVFTYSVKQACEIRKFHVAVVQRRLRNVQKAWCACKVVVFLNINLLVFNCSRCRRRRRCLNSLLLRSRNFATMVTWRHISPLYITIIPRAQMAFGLMGYWLRAHSDSRNNCFSKIQLVGQKYWDKTTLAS